MALTTHASGTTTQTAAGAETDIATINVVGLFRLKLDLDLMAAGDVVYVRTYIIVKTGGASNLAGFTGFYGVDGGLPGGAKVVVFDDDLNDLAETDALQYTIEQPFGTTRALPYGIVRDDFVPVGVSIGVGGIASTAFAAGAIDAAALATDAGQEIADRILARAVAGGADAARNVGRALKKHSNKVTDDLAGTITVYEADDVTPAYTIAVTRTASQNPITSIDPA
jgi:hypothetical protein